MAVDLVIPSLIGKPDERGTDLIGTPDRPPECGSDWAASLVGPRKVGRQSSAASLLLDDQNGCAYGDAKLIGNHFPWSVRNLSGPPCLAQQRPHLGTPGPVGTDRSQKMMPIAPTDAPKS